METTSDELKICKHRQECRDVGSLRKPCTCIYCSSKALHVHLL